MFTPVNRVFYRKSTSINVACKRKMADKTRVIYPGRLSVFDAAYPAADEQQPDSSDTQQILWLMV